MSNQVIVTQDDDGSGGWTFTGEAYSIDSDGTKTLTGQGEASIGSATGVSGWQLFINGASLVLAQLELPS